MKWIFSFIEGVNNSFFFRNKANCGKLSETSEL